MANQAAKERNLATKGRTGPSTIRQRKKRGQKARPNKSSDAKRKGTKVK